MLQKFLKYLRYEKSYSSHTVLSYKNDISQFEKYLIDVFGSPDYLAADSDVIRNYVALMISRKISPRAVGRKLSALRTFYKYLVKEDMLQTSPVSSVPKPKESKPLPSFIRESDMNALFDDADAGDLESFTELRDRLILIMLYHTGMRRAELLGIKDYDVSLDANTIKVTGKRDKQRIIPFGKELSLAISRYKEIRDREVGNKSGVFFVKEDGEPMYPVLIYRIVKRELEKVSTMKKLSPHVLRHTFASAMLNNGANIDSVKELLGHASLNSTQVYTHITFEELKHSYNHAHPRAFKKGGLYGD